jgi:hypothetical protein
VADAQEFVQAVANECRERGYDSAAVGLESAMPDADPTSFGGQGAEKVAEAIATVVYNQVYAEVVDVLQQPVSDEVVEAMKVIGS